MGILRLLAPSAARLDRAAPLRLAVIGAVALLAGGLHQPAGAVAVSEYQVKAVFLFHFAQFVEWPAAAFAEPGGPLVIGILGEDPFGRYLDETVRAETLNNRALRVQRFRRVEEIGTCHLLFISASETERLEQILATLRGRSILTVGDAEGFARRGVMIRFVTERNRIRMKINVEAATAAQLTISSKLLRAAEIVAPGRD